MILPYQSIKSLCEHHNLISPWHERTVAGGKTYGLSSAGYDMRVAQQHILHPGDFVLGSVMEHMNIPEGLMGIVHDKSSWARMGIAVQNTVIEPGWRGYLTVELSNHSKQIITIREGDPICQIIFHTLLEHTEKPYRGKYQDQKQGPQEAIHE